VEAVCYASLEDVVKAATPLLAAAFPAADADAATTPAAAAAGGLKYAVVFESRACDGSKLDRMAVINALAALVPKARTHAGIHSLTHDIHTIIHLFTRIHALPAAFFCPRAAARG
jgi:hypothetical protein